MRMTVELLPGTDRTEDMSDTAVVLPAYNEEPRVAETVAAVLAAGVGLLVCVDDCSTDRTGEILDGLRDRPGVEVIHHPVNRGKQAAVRIGLRRALRHPRLRRIATLDADMQHDPAALPRVAAPVGRWDMVSAVRCCDEMPAARRAANLVANWPYRALAGVPLQDVQSGYRVYTRDVAQYLAANLAEAGRYAIEHSTMVLFGQLSVRWGRPFRMGEVEVPCPYAGIESHVTLRDGLQLTLASLRCALRLARLLRR